MSVRKVEDRFSFSYIERIEKYSKDLFYHSKEKERHESNVGSLIDRLELYYSTPVDVPEDLRRKIKVEFESKVLHDRKRHSLRKLSYTKSAVLLLLISIGLASLFYFLNKGSKEATAFERKHSLYSSVVQAVGQGSSLTFYFKPDLSEEEVELRKGRDGPIIKSFSLRNESVYPVKNFSKEPLLITVWRRSKFYPEVYVIPGTQRSLISKGEGIIEDLAKAIASYYGMPVELVAKDKELSVNWEFKGRKPEDVVASKLSTKSISLQILSSQVILLLQQ